MNDDEDEDLEQQQKSIDRDEEKTLIGNETRQQNEYVSPYTMDTNQSIYENYSPKDSIYESPSSGHYEVSVSLIESLKSQPEILEEDVFEDQENNVSGTNNNKTAGKRYIQKSKKVALDNNTTNYEISPVDSSVRIGQNKDNPPSVGVVFGEQSVGDDTGDPANYEVSPEDVFVGRYKHGDLTDTPSGLYTNVETINSVKTLERAKTEGYTPIERSKHLEDIVGMSYQDLVDVCPEREDTQNTNDTLYEVPFVTSL